MSQYPGNYQASPQGPYGAPIPQAGLPGYPPAGAYPPQQQQQQYAAPPPSGYYNGQQPYYPPPVGQPCYYPPPNQLPQQGYPPQQQYYSQPQYGPPPPVSYGTSNGVPPNVSYQQNFPVTYNNAISPPSAVGFYASGVPPLSPQQIQTMSNELRTAMKGLGADHKTIISIIGNLAPEHSGQLDQAYKASFGKFLHEAISSETSGNYGRLAVACSMSLSDYDARCLREAMKGIGTDEEVLIETLVGRTNAEMRAIKESYYRIFNRDLEKDIKSETQGNYEHTLVVLIQGQRVETPQIWDVASDVAALYAAGEGRIGCDPLVFVSILCNRPEAHLQAVYDYYLKTHGKSLEKVIKSETGHNFEKTLLSIVHSTKDRSAYIAGLIEKSMAGIGCDEHALTRLIARHRDPRVMAQIKAAYVRLYNKNLYSRVSSETGHHFRDLLLTIIKN